MAEGGTSKILLPIQKESCNSLETTEDVGDPCSPSGSSQEIAIEIKDQKSILPHKTNESAGPNEVATTETDWSKKIQCRYFLHGVCIKGDQCLYAHDHEAPAENSVPRFQQFGKSCKNNCIRSFSAKLIDDDSMSVSSKKKLVAFTAPSKFHIPMEAKSEVGIGEFELIQPVDNVKLHADIWVNAAEFVPGQNWTSSFSTLSYRDVAKIGLPAQSLPGCPYEPVDEPCPNGLRRDCENGHLCPYKHGELCEFCHLVILDPDDPDQCSQHIMACVEQHEEDMEWSFIVQQSQEKTCGICMEVVMEKQPEHMQRFGILSACSHVFCLDCIRKWRSAKQFENKIVRACPECRVKSDFVTPSKYWVDKPEDKQKLIEGYKLELKKRHCKHFNRGKGVCPFNAHCFYKHEYPDGRPASPRPQNRRYEDSGGELRMIERLLLLDFILQDDIDLDEFLMADSSDEYEYDSDLDHIFF